MLFDGQYATFAHNRFAPTRAEEAVSIRSVTDLAVARDMATHGTPVPAAPGRRRGGRGADAKVETTGDALISSIPTEIVGTYTALVGVLTPLVDDNPGSYLPLRWILFASFLLLTWVTVIIIYSRKRSREPTARRKLPVVECLASAIAFAGWALVMPASALSAVVSDDLYPFVSAAVVVIALFLLTAVTGQPIKTGSKTG